jgi:hypothetical protein
MAVLKRLDILAAKDLKQQAVDVPEWGGEVIVSEIGAADFMSLWTDPRYMGEDGKNPDIPKLMPALVVRCLVDEEGQRIFSDEDAEMLGRKSPAAFNRIAQAAKDLNGIGDQEQQVKNSEPSTVEDSSSVSA